MGLKWLFLAGLVLASLALIGYGLSRYNDMVRADERDAIWESIHEISGCPSIECLETSIKAAQDAINTQNAAVAKLRREAAERANAVAKAQALRAPEDAKTSAYVSQLLSQQPAHPEDSCRSACSLLRSQPLR